MIIELGKIEPEGLSLTGEEPGAMLDLGGLDDIRSVKAVRYDLLARKTEDTLVVTGTLETDVEFRCSRCAEFYPSHVQESRFEVAREILPGSESEDLTEDIRETILLAFPTYPVCRAGCKGLCPQCGANLNERPCSCRPQKKGGWEALDSLRIT